MSRKQASKVAGPAQDWVAQPQGPGAGLDSGIFSFPGPGEQRAQPRTPQRELGHVIASLRVEGGEWTPVRLCDFSSIGFGILYQPHLSLAEPILARKADGAAPVTAPLEPMPAREGDEVELRLGVRHHKDFQVRCRVENAGPWKEGLKLGLRRLDVTAPEPAGRENRGALRLSLTAPLALKARIRHPFLYGHWCPLVAADVNRDLGFSFLSEDPSILLFEGLELEIHFEIASQRRRPMLARVAWVRAAGSDQVRFGIDCLALDFSLHNAVCDYLLFTQFWPPSKLREAGFEPAQVRSHLRFGTVKTMEDYAEVLHLRRDACVAAGKRPPDTKPEQLSSPLDGRSRILMARHHDKLVGTMTFTFPAFEDTVLDTQSGFPGAKFPVPMPPKANLIEVARLCIDADYKGTDLLQGMFEHGLKHFLTSDRHWLVASATEEQLPVYEGIGFVRANASYKHPLFNQKEHHLILAHRNAFLGGLGINVLTWNSVFGDMVRHLMERRLVEMPGWMKAIVKAKLLLRPLARRFTDGKARRAFRKHMDALRRRASAGASER